MTSVRQSEKDRTPRRRQRADGSARQKRVAHESLVTAWSEAPIMERPSWSITIVGESFNTGLHVVWTELSRHVALS